MGCVALRYSVGSCFFILSTLAGGMSLALSYASPITRLTNTGSAFVPDVNPAKHNQTSHKSHGTTKHVTSSQHHNYLKRNVSLHSVPYMANVYCKFTKSTPPCHNLPSSVNIHLFSCIVELHRCGKYFVQGPIILFNYFTSKNIKKYISVALSDLLAMTDSGLLLLLNSILQIAPVQHQYSEYTTCTTPVQ